MKHALFPVGEYTKPEICQIAEKHGLPTASRKDLQDLCFLRWRRLSQLATQRGGDARRGEIVTREGQAIGSHNGLANYTIGQRKGLGVASPVPLYVITKDVVRNTLIVGTQDELGLKELIARDVNWVSGEAL
ncbi:MAG: tRNA methyl transferase PRC-barrel domain-containing protein [Anaerolineales bacterium]